jgi:hypothetical protein
VLSSVWSRTGSRAFVMRGQYVGTMGRVTRLEPHGSTLVVMLDAAKREVVLQKGMLLQATIVEEEAWTVEKMASFAHQVYVHNFFNHKSASPGQLICMKPIWYCIQFATRRRNVPKIGLHIMGGSDPSFALDVSGIAVEPPRPMSRPGCRLGEMLLRWRPMMSRQTVVVWSWLWLGEWEGVFPRTCKPRQYTILVWRWLRELAQRT